MYSRDWFSKPRVFKPLMNLWPPLIGAGISVREISDDWMHIKVRLQLRFYNRNYVGTQFGGSLFAMTDPFYMLMLLHHIGDQHWVWDKQAEIEFIKPGKGAVFATFKLDQSRIDDIVAQAAAKEKHFEPFEVEVVDSEGELVARVKRLLYIRRKPKK